MTNPNQFSYAIPFIMIHFDFPFYGFGICEKLGFREFILILMLTYMTEGIAVREENKYIFKFTNEKSAYLTHFFYFFTFNKFERKTSLQPTEFLQIKYKFLKYTSFLKMKWVSNLKEPVPACMTKI